MNKKTITQLVIVRGDTAEEFQDKFNSTMAALADQNPQFKFNPDLEFCAFITYEETEHKAETVEDEYHVRIDHAMTREHYISFIAAISQDGVQFKKLYPEQDAMARFKRAGVRHVVYYCNRDGLFSLTSISR